MNLIPPLTHEVKLQTGKMSPVHTNHQGCESIRCEGTEKHKGCGEWKYWTKFHPSMLKTEKPRCKECLKKADDERTRRRIKERSDHKTINDLKTMIENIENQIASTDRRKIHLQGQLAILQELLEKQ